MTSSLVIALIGFATKVVLALLVALSVWSFAVMIDRRKVFRGITSEGELERLKARIQKKESPISSTSPQTLLSQSAALLVESPQNAEAIAYALKSMLTDERSRLSKGLPILATLGSNAPFIGLFGTVLGIIQSFATLSEGTGDMNQVILRLSEALVTTAVGLFVAIPAVIAYNGFSNQLKKLFQEAESLRDFYLSHKIFSEKN